ncbi:MAG: septum formation initiator family protein [Methylacidiphilales bacterium]|nr:septum formation initiator family protein [Candidatus Methylacidiphilales bacterium]
MAGARFLDPSSVPLKRQSGGNIWATLVHVTQGITVVLLLSVLMLFFLPVIQKTHRLQEEKAHLQDRINEELDQQHQLQVETEYMKNNPDYIEHIARDRLNMGKPGETILRFDPYQPETSNAKLAPPVSNGN